MDATLFPNMQTTIEEIRIQGRTEALDFVGTLIEQWKKMAEDYRDKMGSSNAMSTVYDECADMLEKEIEEFANT